MAFNGFAASLPNRFFPTLFAGIQGVIVLLASNGIGPVIMRTLIALIAIVYLVGVGVALSPTIGAKWNSASASDLATSVGQALPKAVAWPARAYHSMTNHG